MNWSLCSNACSTLFGRTQITRLAGSDFCNSVSKILPSGVPTSFNINYNSNYSYNYNQDAGKSSASSSKQAHGLYSALLLFSLSPFLWDPVFSKPRGIAPPTQFIPQGEGWTEASLFRLLLRRSVLILLLEYESIET